jgi:hypothetical protein
MRRSCLESTEIRTFGAAEDTVVTSTSAAQHNRCAARNQRREPYPQTPVEAIAPRSIIYCLSLNR